MEFLTGSLLELITQTSTNLPPDVRAAMSLTAGRGNARDAVLAGAQHHSVEHRHGGRRRRAHLPGHRHADVRGAYAGGREPDRDQGGDSRGGRRGHPARQAAAQFGRFDHRQEQRRQPRAKRRR